MDFSVVIFAFDWDDTHLYDQSVFLPFLESFLPLSRRAKSPPKYASAWLHQSNFSEVSILSLRTNKLANLFHHQPRPYQVHAKYRFLSLLRKCFCHWLEPT